MIPVGVGVVSGGSFPLTVNGKVDKKALPQVMIGGGGGEGKVEARTETEMELVGVFEAVSEAVGVGIDDEFFAIGGNSFWSDEGC